MPKPEFGQVLIRSPRPRRHAKVGVPIYTGEYPRLFEEPKPMVPNFGDHKLGERSLSYSAGIDKWKGRFRDSLRVVGVDQETGTYIYNQFHFRSVEIADSEIKKFKNKVQAGFPLFGNERFYSDPFFFRNRLVSNNLRADDLYEIALIALRIDRVYPEKRNEFLSVGISLLEAAENASPNNPKFKLALWREYERLMDERRIRNQKAEGGNDLNVDAFNVYNARQIFEYGTPQYYREEIKKWQDFLDSLADRRKIDYSLFRKEHEVWVRHATINRDMRNYDGNKVMFRLIDFKEAYRNEDPDAFIMGLTGLYGIRKTNKRKKDIEPFAFKLLTKGAELPPPPRFTRKWPRPWPVFVAYVMVKEYYRLLGLTKVVSKPEAKRREFQDNFLRVNEQRYAENYRKIHGKDPEPVRNTQPISLNYVKTDPEDDEIPF